MGTVVATPAAIGLIMRLRAECGVMALRHPVDPPSEVLPVRLTEAQLPGGSVDLQIGEVGGIPLLFDGDLYLSLRSPDLIVDVAAGEGESEPSLEMAEDVRRPR